MTDDSADLPFLLLGAFRALIDRVHAELAAEGHAGARPTHAFGLQAIGPDGVRLGELAHRLGISKQAVTKAVASLELAGYAERSPDPDDARASLVRRTPRGEELLQLSAATLRRAYRQLAREVGRQQAEDMVDTLRVLAGDAPVAAIPAWLSG